MENEWTYTRFGMQLAGLVLVAASLWEIGRFLEFWTLLGTFGWIVIAVCVVLEPGFLNLKSDSASQA